METTFTPLAAMFGGVLIGASAVLLMLVHGKIAGSTGILAGVLLPSSRADWTWRAAMLAGMIAAPVVFLLVTGSGPEIQVPVPLAALVVGGLLVGFGASLGSGCTSGHGVCGLARLSARSLVATLTFMAATAVTVFLVRHVVGG
ncbi:MAG: YeeE/YedE family protein [Hyphomicrobiaceae bacterium]